MFVSAIAPPHPYFTSDEFVYNYPLQPKAVERLKQEFGISDDNDSSRGNNDQTRKLIRAGAQQRESTRNEARLRALPKGFLVTHVPLNVKTISQFLDIGLSIEVKVTAGLLKLFGNFF